MTAQILVLGATGTVGKPLVEALLARGESVKAASRSGQAVTGAAGVALDFTRPETFAAALEGVDRVYVSSPAGVVDAASLLRPFVAAAIERKCKIVIHTAIGVDVDDNIPLRQLELQIERSGLPYVILRPNWFMDNFTTYWLAAIKTDATITLPAGDARTSFIAAEDIARAAAAALTSDRFDGRALVLTGDESLSYDEAASILTAASGQDIRYQAGDDAGLIAYLTKQGLSADYAHVLVTLFGVVAQGWVAAPTPDFRELTGRAAIRLADYAAANAATWQGANA